MRTHTFGELFKLFRLRAGIETLSSFANMMAEHGMVYENSLYSRWQRNERIPRDRKVLLLVAKILNEHKGIASKDEVNLLLDSVDQRELTNNEEEDFSFLKQAISSSMAENKKYTLEKTTFPSLFSSLLNPVALIILLFFFIQCAWFYRIWINNLYGTMEGYICGWTYGFIGITGAIYGLLGTNQAANKPFPVRYFQRNAAIRYLCYGLLGQCFGLQIWFVYNLKGVDMPYPSLAELGYFSTIPSYTLAALTLTNDNIIRTMQNFQLKKIIVFSLPIVILVVSLSVYFLASGINLFLQFTTFFGLVYPIGDMLPILIILYHNLFHSKNQKFNRLNLLVLIGFFIQFAADYGFVLSAKNGTYITTGMIDVILMLGYSYMAFIVIAATKSNLGFAEKYQTLKTNTSYSEPLFFRPGRTHHLSSEVSDS